MVESGIERLATALARGDAARAVRLAHSVLDRADASTAPAIDGRLAQACVEALGNDEDQGVDQVVESILLRRGRGRPFLAVKALAALRAVRTDEARALWNESWRAALVDDTFARVRPLTIPSTTAGNRVFRPARRREDARLQDDHAPFCVYTALFGEYDALTRPLYRPPELDFICFSDRPRDVAGWDVRVVDPGEDHPALQNRKLKILPYEHLGAYAHSLYVDASMMLLCDPLALFHHWLRDRRFVAWSHPVRADVYRECEAILASLKCPPDPVVDQVEFFRSEGVPAESGLIEASFLWRSHRDPGVRDLMHAWWDHVKRFGARDQPGLGYCMWKTGTRPEVLPDRLGTVRRNEFVVPRPHAMTAIEVERARGAPPTPRPQRGLRRLAWVYRRALRHSGSTTMRGHQLSDLARRHLGDDVEVSCLDETVAPGLSDAIVILTKGFLEHATPAELATLRDAGNVVCADFVDAPARSELDEHIDAYVAASIGQFLRLSKTIPDKPVHLVTHHTDPLIHGLAGPADHCSIGYFGEMANARHRCELQGIIDFCQVDTKVADTRWIPRLRHANVHYAVRERRPIDGFKPFLKGFTAARCRANIIVPLVESDARYYLGSDYPYILGDDSLAAVLEMIDRVHDSFGGPEWNRGLEIMESVRARCSTEQIAIELRELVTRLR